jgi:hypothetical protein
MYKLLEFLQLTQVLPYIMVPDSEFVVVVQGKEAQFECKLLFGFEQGQTIRWNWFLDGQLLENSANTVITYENEISTLTFKNTDTTSRNQIECRAQNVQVIIHVRSVIDGKKTRIVAEISVLKLLLSLFASHQFQLVNLRLRIIIRDG